MFLLCMYGEQWQVRGKVKGKGKGVALALLPVLLLSWDHVFAWESQRDSYSSWPSKACCLPGSRQQAAGM